MIAPLIRSPSVSPQTLYTVLCLAQKIIVSVVGIHRRTVITLDLDLYEREEKSVEIRDIEVAGFENGRIARYVCTLNVTWKIH